MPVIVVFVSNFFSITLVISSPFLLAFKVSTKKSTDSFMGFHYMWCVIFFMLLWKFSPLTFNSLIIKCLTVIFGFILLRFLWVSCTWIFISLPKFWKYSVVISLNKFSSFFSLLFLELPQCRYLCSRWYPTIQSVSLFYFFSLANFKCSVFEFADFSSVYFKSVVEVLYWIFQLSLSSALGFLFFFLWFLFFIKLLILLMHCFPNFFSCLSVFSCILLNFFKMIILNSL